MILPQYLQSLRPMPPAVAEHISSFFEETQLPKQYLLVQEGKTSQRSYYLQKGIIRCYTTDLNGDEVTTRIYSAPDFLNDYLSFFRRKPSEENYEALTECQVWGINFENVQHCFHEIPEFREWGRMMLTMNYVKLHERMLSFHKQSAEERYRQLLHQHPEVILEVPLQIIASYIGSTKSSLSRIRREVAGD